MSEQNAGERTDQQTRCARPYRLGRRTAGVEETRARILDAARELILGDDVLAGFSLDAVARQTGVTRVTVYDRFGSKRGLLEALFDQMGERGGLAQRIPEVFGTQDPAAALRAYIGVFCDFWAADRVLTRRLRAFAALDEVFGAAIAARDDRRRRIVDALLNRLAAGSKSAAVIGDQANGARVEVVRTVMALTSFEFYDVIVGDRTPGEVAMEMYLLLTSALEAARLMPQQV